MDSENTAAHTALDPLVTDPGSYRVLLENDRVRVLEFLDAPGDETNPHEHPDSVMITLNAYARRLSSEGREIDVELPAGETRWLPAQEHAGLNIGSTPSHAIFVELKEAPVTPRDPGYHPLGPVASNRPLSGTPLSDASSDEEKAWGFA
ncbi:cupin domain-containing protein [Cryobacterium cryoconiti]|uniref:cupin domain-containing protein n=1 Tax=Cryobacterium cryoconiti TaxID=1259239 RepID=UPI001F5478AB|nr:cytoplasmic protein [Cryobacterium cryoconiti]